MRYSDCTLNSKQSNIDKTNNHVRLLLTFRTGSPLKHQTTDANNCKDSKRTLVEDKGRENMNE